MSTLLTLSGPVHPTRTNAMTGNNWAIVVGINQYEHLPSDDHLKYAVKDALAMQAFLCDQAQFPADNVLVCCDPQVSGYPSSQSLRTARLATQSAATRKRG